MYHEPSKSRQLFMRIFVYSGMTIAVAVLVALLVFYMLGYQFDRQQGRLEQNGLIQYVTNPSGATIEVDGATLPNKSSAKSSVAPGPHEFVMWREGYETWRKTLTIEAGTLTWLNYARLVPKKRPIEMVIGMSKVAASLASPSGQFMAVLPVANVPTLEFYDLRSDTVKQTAMTLTSSDYTDAGKEGTTHTFEFSEWDKSGRYLLLKHNYGDMTEWLAVDVEARVLRSNVSKTMDIKMSEVHFSGTSGNLFIVLSEGDIRRVDISAGTLSRPLANNVAEFTMHGQDRIGFISIYDATLKQRIVGLISDGNTEPDILRTSTSSPDVPLHIQPSRYFNKDFVVITEGKSVSILEGESLSGSKDIASNSSMHRSFDFFANVQWLQTSDNGRFVIVQNGSSYVGYDLERKTLSSLATLSGDTPTQKLRWLDDYYVWSDQSNVLTIREFDGANQHVINSVASGFDATFSQNGRYLYSIGKVDAGFQLQRVRMILN